MSNTVVVRPRVNRVIVRAPGPQGPPGDVGGVSVTSVAGRTGAVTLTKGDVGLANVDNTADASKPVSTAQAAADTAVGNAAATALSTHAAATSSVHGISAFGATLVDDASASEARTTLGLGTAATAATGDFAAASHTHTLSNLTQSGATTGQVAQWNGTAWVPATSSGGGSTNVWLPAAQWIPRTTNGCGVDSIELSANRVNLDELLFDAASVEYAQLSTVMPSNWNLGTITARFHWRASSGSGDVVWALSARSYANDDALDQATGTAQSATDTLTAANDLCVSPATPAITVTGTAASGNLVLFEVSRTATSGGDTLAVDARLIGVEISYTST